MKQIHKEYARAFLLEPTKLIRLMGIIHARLADQARMIRALFLVPVSLLVLVTVGFGQHGVHGGVESIGWVPREILQRPVTFRDGIGMINDPVTTPSPEAQRFYNQGLAYIHSYVWIEAARSCNQALRLDPKLALAYLCLSRAYSGLEDQTAAQKAVEMAKSLAAELSEREQLRVSLRSTQMGAITDILNSAKHQAYKKALDDALTKYPGDAELWLLRGNAEEPTAAGRGQRGLVGAIAYYQAALAVSPANPAAEHYLVHAYETIGQPAEAVRHGEIYAKLCAAIPHAQHMYGHDLRLVGRIDEAIAQFRKADDLETAYYKDQKIPARYDWHRIHNLDLMAGSYEFKGQIRQAEELLRQFFSLPANDGLWASYQADWPRFLLSRGRPTEALVAAGRMAHGKFSLERSMGLLFAARALVAVDRVEEAQEEMAEAEKELQNVPESDPEPLMPQPRAVLAGQIQILRGEIALHKGNTELADSVLDEVLHRFVVARGSADAVNYLFTMLYIAQQAHAFEDWGLLDRAATQMLSFDPSYAGGHYIAALVAEHKGDSALARRELTAGQTLWSRADPDLAELTDIHNRLAAAR